MRAFAVAAVIAAAAALVACRSDHPPQSASVPEPAAAQDTQPVPSAGQTVATPAPGTAQLPLIHASAPANLNANGPPLNILKPPQ